MLWRKRTCFPCSPTGYGICREDLVNQFFVVSIWFCEINDNHRIDGVASLGCEDRFDQRIGWSVQNMEQNRHGMARIEGHSTNERHGRRVDRR